MVNFRPDFTLLGVLDGPELCGCNALVGQYHSNYSKP